MNNTQYLKMYNIDYKSIIKTKYKIINILINTSKFIESMFIETLSLCNNCENFISISNYKIYRQDFIHILIQNFKLHY